MLPVDPSLAMAERPGSKRRSTGSASDDAATQDPSSVSVEAGVVLERDTWIGRGCIIKGKTTVSSTARIEAYCVIEDSLVAKGAHIREFSHCYQAEIGEKSIIGPYARLREQSIIGKAARIGNFVETKKTVVEEGAKANHLSYLGDATVGAKANIGAGTITCNYDGYSKSNTIIREGAFIGSNSALVAPVRIGKGAIVGAGSVIVKEVPDDAIAITRSSQRNLTEAAISYRAKRSSE